MRFSRLWIALLLIWSLGPLAWQLYTSFCSDQALLDPFSAMDHRWTLSHYQSILNGDPPFWRYLLNSLMVSSFSTLLTLIVAFPAAYALNRIGKAIARTLTAGLVLAALFPFVLLFLALLEIARSFNLGNHLLALSLPYAALSQPLAVLILAAAIRDLPNELEDAARLEGLTLWQRVRWILLPLLGPSLTSTGILVFIFCWNEYPIALTWISDTQLLTLPVAIARIAGSSVYSVPYGAYAAATVLAAIPLISLVFIFQRSIISGLTTGAVKS